MPQQHYTQISLEERIIIQNRLENGESIRCIARSIGRNINGLPDGIYKVATIYEGNGYGGEKIGFVMEDGSVWYASVYKESGDSGALEVNMDMVAKKVNISGFVKDVLSIDYCGIYCNASTIFLMSDNSIIKYDESMFE